MKTLKLMPVCASGGLLSVRASEFLKVESGGDGGEQKPQGSGGEL